MNRGAFWGAFVAALAVGLAFRLADPDVRPMHHDEANQAVRFGTLLETGEYRYDPHDHHGPTLYYLTLPVAWARGQHSLAELDERTLRMVPALFGAGLIVLFLLLSNGIGRAAVVAAAALAAVSPPLTYYNRFYIQESLFVFFALAFLIALGRYTRRPTIPPAIWAGVLAGLAYATKETSLIVLPAAGVASALATMASRKPADRPHVGARTRALHALAAICGALVPTFLLYSSFLHHPGGLVDSVSALSIYFERGVDAGGHVEPWFYYLQTLAWSSSGGLVWTDALVLVLAAAGIAHALVARKSSFWPLYLSLYSLVTMGLFSALPYKTPWNLLPFYTGMVLMAGIGVASVFERARSRSARVLIAVVLVAAGWHLAMQSRRASFVYAADPRNPYAYAQTSTDFVRLASRVHDLAATHPDGRAMLVKVVAGPYEQWPFPWYVRDLSRVGYWSRAADAGALEGTPVILASQENAGAVESAVGDRYISEFYGLRPGVLLTLYVERGLWERFIESRHLAPGAEYL
jgi:uncharacterized protein (TIGR03663 family)